MLTLPYLSFGSQYYRAPTPRPDAWADDFRHMREQGINTVKLWVCWRANNPREGVYDFWDIDELMRLADENGIGVILNTIFDTAPAWFFRKYPESVMLTNGLGPIYPTATACRQIGGAPGPCYHHEAGITARREFLIEIAKRYHNHPALLYWDVWNEPEHTCAIKRRPIVENLTCYCSASEAAFKSWLKARYGSIDALNRVWGRVYADFDEVELPRLAEGFNDMIDWRLFMTDTITEECRMRMDALRSIDKTHPAMVHAVTLPFFPLATCGSDDVALARMCDLFGNSVGSEPLSAAIAISAAEGKPVINAEIHAVGGSTYARPKLNTIEDMKRHLLVPLGLGIKGLMFWQYRPERIGLESPAWGLTKLNGSETECLRASCQIHDALAKHADTILHSAPPESDIAILADRRAQLFDFCVQPAAQRYVRSIQGAYACLRALGYAPRIVTDVQLNADALASFRVLYDPFPYYKDAASCAVLRDWVSRGGTLIAEACFGGYSADDGLHTMNQPGFGFGDVFGADEENATSAAHFANAYDEGWADGRGDAPVRMSADGRDYTGALIVQRLKPTSAEIIARYADGSAAITHGLYGKGHAIWIGTLPMLAYQDGHTENAELIRMLLDTAGAARPILDAGRTHVCATLLSGDAGRFVVVDNASSQDGVLLSDATDALRCCTLENVLTGARYSPAETLPVRAGTTEAYWLN